MLYSKINKTPFNRILALIIVTFGLLSSCMPVSTPPAVNLGSSTEAPSETNSTYPEPTYPLNGIFIQEGATRSNSNISIPLEFNDSFLIRGKDLSVYLRKVPNSTKFCLVGKYNYVVGQDKFLILSAKSRSYTDQINKTTEFYLQIEPANDVSNQNDCLTYNLTNSLFLNSTNPSAFFSLKQLCTDCTSFVTSNSLRLFFINGEEVPSINTSSLLLTLSGSLTNSGNSCTDSNACQARNYDCCLDSQCVNDGAIKPGAMLDPGFVTAQEDVRLNPQRYVVYPNYYFVCGTRPSNSGGSGEEPGDPDYEAQVRLLEFGQLYDCINKVDGEFSFCTLKYTNANEIMPHTFSSADDGYKDDINFATLNPNLSVGDKVNNIVKILYAGMTIYEQDKVSLSSGSYFVSGTANDNLTNSQSVHLNLTTPSNAKDSHLYITYKVDGTCEKLSTNISKCTKSYVQSFSDTSSTMWHDSTKTYKLPSYADTSINSSIIVKVSGVVIPEDPTTWTKYENPKQIVFANSYPIYQNQLVEITYFVNTNASELIKIKQAAQDKVNQMCNCAPGSKCNLKPLADNNTNEITNYECTYPNLVNDQPPVNQTVYVSNKNIPHRYYDANGVSYDSDYGPALDQELTAFKYTNNDLLKPNNLDTYIGFNEIYGSFGKTGSLIARPAKMVRVKKDTLYDIVVNSGSFSSCNTCGSDYYSILQKIFPQNFGGQGGGYTPDNYTSQRENSTSIYRSDDLLFGRACFIPATMIPWTHLTSSTPKDQRRGRLNAQHFLFANGYNRDWFGFDYGSLIGSFDGVKWFSIGNQRRIKATSSKLYLAVNAYYGDLNVDNNFNVNIGESSIYSSNIPDHDNESDGAQCQKSHFCSKDDDCFRQLGYDYTCQNIASINTQWPVFDANGSELVGSNLRSLVSIVGGTNGQAKRCVYRGRGTPCLKDLNLASSATNFNDSSIVGTLSCSHNNSCVSLSTSNRFNDRISRFGTSTIAQNIAEVTPDKTDLVGLGSRILLRPFDYYGKKSVPSSALPALSANNIDSICIPGRDLNAASDTFNLNLKHPNVRTETSDKIFGVGPTHSSSMNIKSLNACPATTASGQSVQTLLFNLGTPELNKYSISQNMSSNLLKLQPLIDNNIYSSTNGSQVTAVGYQRNTCLRAPGASCFSDMECAPSSFIANKARSVNLSGLLNPAEIEFWKEELVCGNPEFKYVAPGSLNPEFNLLKNKCCREFGKTLKVYTQTSSSDYKWCDQTTSSVNVAGINQDISSFSRYSRVHTAFDKMTCDRTQINSSTSFALSLEANNSIDRMKQILGQYKTLDTLNQRTCCTNHWVRNFASENGGGHAFDKSKFQIIDKKMFRNITWEPDNQSVIIPDPDSAFECSPDNYLNGSCEIKSMSPAEMDLYLTWAGSLELIGIPQVAIKTTTEIYKLVDDNQNAIIPGSPLTDSGNKSILLPANIFNADFEDGSNKLYYSGTNYTQLNMVGPNKNGMKKIFSESEFNCCVPSGQEIPQTTTANDCCTGFAASINGTNRCCLPDFTDVTLYLNRYVSSEGRGLSDSAYDQATGYIKDSGQVSLMAAQKNLCCSGTTMTGVAISKLPIPLTGGTYIPANDNATTTRFNYLNNEIDNNTETGNIGSLFDVGVRWNNHVYCVPQGLGP